VRGEGIRKLLVVGYYWLLVVREEGIGSRNCGLRTIEVLGFELFPNT
jgi:hypothetical protein